MKKKHIGKILINPRRFNPVIVKENKASFDIRKDQEDEAYNHLGKTVVFTVMSNEFAKINWKETNLKTK